jgi:hypothetical protein
MRMIDHEVKNFYQAVKDSSWPDIQTYFDFTQLPAHIKNECNELHNFQPMKILGYEKFIGNTRVWVHKDLAFVPIPKCGLVYYANLFSSLGWERKLVSDIDIKTTKFFGTMMHPLSRWLKGITQWLVFSYAHEPHPTKHGVAMVHTDRAINWEKLKQQLNDINFQQILRTISIGDVHSEPYSTMFGPFLDQVHWIPMDIMSDDDAKISMMNFFKLQGHNITLPLGDSRRHVSSENQIEIFNLIKEITLDDATLHYTLHRFFINDLSFYYNLLDTFKSDWQHITS